MWLARGRPGQHQATPLHWAAFHGNDEMAQAILHLGPPLEVTDADFHGTPLGWAIHGSEHGWHSSSGNYAATVEALLKSGAKVSDDAGEPNLSERCCAATGPRTNRREDVSKVAAIVPKYVPDVVSDQRTLLTGARSGETAPKLGLDDLVCQDRTGHPGSARIAQHGRGSHTNPKRQQGRGRRTSLTLFKVAHVGFCPEGAKTNQPRATPWGRTNDPNRPSPERAIHYRAPGLLSESFAEEAGFQYLLPVGISFFTFQSLSYTIDFYLGNVRRERNFLRFATFVCFFRN